MRRRTATGLVLGVFAAGGLAVTGQVAAVGAPLPGTTGPDARTAQVVAHWTPERRAQAVSRDIVVDAHGRSFVRGPDGTWQPYGSTTAAGLRAVPQPTGGSAAAAPAPAAAPSADTTAPTITGLDPAGGTILTTADRTFKATVTDDVGLRSVAFVITYPDKRTQSFAAAKVTGSDVWSVAFSGFSNGEWTWQVVAKDTASRGGNTARSALTAFTVRLGGGSTPSPGDVANASWTDQNSTVKSSSGRLYFEMPANRQATRWSGYVCSGTVVDDGGTSDTRSLLLTAAHCVYDEANKAFARNVLFIPDQAFSGTKTDLNCGNDKIGCWAPTAGVVDADWTTRQWPDNIPWDYGYYRVPNSGAHTPGKTSAPDALESAVKPMSVRFAAPAKARAAAFGYSYSNDPYLMYCTQARGYTGGASAGASDNWWLGQCGLSGGASGGPWLDEDPVSGSGDIISVNSWGYSNSPGMAGPKLDGTSASTRARLPSCIYQAAKTATANKIANSCS